MDGLQRYGDYRPTGFDPRGLGLPDRQDWIVVPVGRTRDTSDPRSLSNWHSALRILGDESETVEVHRFGHWGPGWFEIILVHPSREAEVEEIAGALANYPILDEDDASEREMEAQSEDWDRYGAKDCADKIADVFDLSEAAHDWLREHGEDLFSLHRDRSCGDSTDHEGTRFDFGWIGRSGGWSPIQRDDLAFWIRAVRCGLDGYEADRLMRERQRALRTEG